MATKKEPQLLPVDPERVARARALAERAPVPASVGNVRTGTAGWSDKTLLESGFYPARTATPEARLRHYSAHFGLVEVDATYYSLLPAELAARWVQWTPRTFRFDVKAFPSFTGHPIDTGRLPRDLKLACEAAGLAGRTYADALPRELQIEMASRFIALLEPMANAGRLGAVLLQFPPWFAATRGNVRRIEALRSDYPELPFSVEFRNASWLEPERRARVFDMLRAQRFTYVCVDEPGMPLVVEATQPELAIVRFHGKNSAWATKGVSVRERFDYLYDPAELVAWLEPVKRLADQTSEVHAVFNNCIRNYAVLGAQDLAALLAEGSIAPPQEPS